MQHTFLPNSIKKEWWFWWNYTFFCTFSFKICDFWWNRIASIFCFFSEKIKNLVLPFISAQNVSETHEFFMKTIYKPTTFCGEGFLGLDSIQLLQNSQKIYFSYSLLNYKICVFFHPNTSSKMELSIVYSFSSIKLKFVLKQKPFGKILRFL